MNRNAFAVMGSYSYWGRVILSIKPLLFVTPIVFALGSCSGGSGGNGTDTTAPTTISVAPADGATDVALDSVVTATFDEDMLATTVNGASFTLTGNTAAGGVVTFDSQTNVASFTPDRALGRLTTYTATLTTDIADLAGNALASDHNWSFTTADASFSDPGGVLDPSFAVGGVYTDPAAGHPGTTLGLQSSDKIILGGSDGAEWTVIRLGIDGSLDSTFGASGEATVITTQPLRSMCIGADDSILLVSPQEAYKLDIDGNLDATFGVAGRYAFTGWSVHGAVQDSVGSYWFGGHAGVTMSIENVTAGGVLIASYSPMVGSVQVYGMDIDDSDNLYPVGVVDASGWKGMVAKVTPAGVLDPVFGTGSQGWVALAGPGDIPDTKRGVVFDDGSVVVSGVLDASKDMFMAKVDSAGVLDTTFGIDGNGYVQGGYGGTVVNFWFQGWGLEQLENGKILVSGTDADDGTVAKYSADGILDTGFGTNGIFRIDIGGLTDIVECFAVNVDGTFIITGHSDDGVYGAKIH
ncbi:MAG: hypothetical protein GY722_05575 [bacterium]|nr:hypothetical protein [bacterium]